MAFGDITQSKEAGQKNPYSALFDVDFDSTPTEGSLLICHHFTGDGNSIAPSGFTEAIAVTDSSMQDQGAIYYKIAGSSESTTVTVEAGTSDEHMVQILEVEGPWNTSPLDKTASDGPYSGFWIQSSGTTATTSQADEFAAVLMTIREDAANTDAWTNSFIEENEGVPSDHKALASAHKVLTATGAIETTVTWDNGSGAAKMGAIATFMKAGASTQTIFLPIRR